MRGLLARARTAFRVQIRAVIARESGPGVWRPSCGERVDKILPAPPRAENRQVVSVTGESGMCLVLSLDRM